jgi:hypothetical protein
MYLISCFNQMRLGIYALKIRHPNVKINRRYFWRHLVMNVKAIHINTNQTLIL